jgi:hypothetical protein
MDRPDIFIQVTMNKDPDDLVKTALYDRFLQGKKSQILGPAGTAQGGGGILGVKIGGYGKDQGNNIPLDKAVCPQQFIVEGGDLPGDVFFSVEAAGSPPEGGDFFTRHGVSFGAYLSRHVPPGGGNDKGRKDRSAGTGGDPQHRGQQKEEAAELGRTDERPQLTDGPAEGTEPQQQSRQQGKTKEEKLIPVGKALSRTCGIQKEAQKTKNCKKEVRPSQNIP